jgi:hypothetical protein
MPRYRASERTEMSLSERLLLSRTGWEEMREGASARAGRRKDERRILNR